MRLLDSTFGRICNICNPTAWSICNAIISVSLALLNEHESIEFTRIKNIREDSENSCSFCPRFNCCDKSRVKNLKPLKLKVSKKYH